LAQHGLGPGQNWKRLEAWPLALALIAHMRDMVSPWGSARWLKFLACIFFHQSCQFPLHISVKSLGTHNGPRQTSFSMASDCGKGFSW